MELNVLIVFIFNVLSLIFIFSYFNKKQKLNSAQTLKQISKSLESEHIKKLNEGIVQLSKQLESSLEEPLKSWENKINKENDERKLELLEAAFARYPKEKKFIDRIRIILTPLATTGENLLIRRESLIRLRDHANLFISKCDSKDIDYALDFRNDVISSMEAVVIKIDELRKNSLTSFLKELERQIALLVKSPSDEILLQKIEELDQKIDKDSLSIYPSLQIEYEKLSKSLIKILTTSEKESKTELKKLNEKALNDAKKAHELFKNHSEGGAKDKLFGPKKPVNYNKEKNLVELVKLISNNNSNKLHPSTVNYIKVIESEIFAALSFQGKELFTDLIIKEAYK